MYQIPRLRHLNLQTKPCLISCTRFHAFDTSTFKQHHISCHVPDSTPSTLPPSNNTTSHIMYQIPRLRHLHLQTTPHLISCTRFHAFDTSTFKQHHVSYHAPDSTPSTLPPSNNNTSHIMHQIPRLRHLHLQTTPNLISCTRFHAFDTSTFKQHHISYHVPDSTPSTPPPSNNTTSHIMYQIPRLRHLHLQTTHQHAYLLTHLLSSHDCTV